MSFQPQVRKSNRERLGYGGFVLFVDKYNLILVHNCLDRFDLKVLRYQLNTPVLGR